MASTVNAFSQSRPGKPAPACAHPDAVWRRVTSRRLRSRGDNLAAVLSRAPRSGCADNAADNPGIAYAQLFADGIFARTLPARQRLADNRRLSLAVREIAALLQAESQVRHSGTSPANRDARAIQFAVICDFIRHLALEAEHVTDGSLTVPSGQFQRRLNRLIDVLVLCKVALQLLAACRREAIRTDAAARV